MDDGSESVEMSLAMLQALAGMGVGTVCATSHYYARENSITMYLARRAAALNALHSAIPAGSSLPHILPAAEAAYFRGMEEHHPERLCIENTRTLMLEMPFSEWTDQQVETEVSTYLSSLANGLDVGYYVYDYDRETASYTSTACDSYTLYFRPMTGAEIQEEQFWEKVERGEAAYEDYYKQDFWLNFQGDNARKHILLFGDESKSRFASQEEAAAAMTTVTVPVWQLSGGEKVSSTLTLSVHAALAEDVKEIFAEIYNDPEHFPIHDVGGYAWRGDSATGEHNCGTAIDINANENYQIRDGQVLAGSCWEPGSNAYSISPDSSVVRIFAEHGWSWGGDAWAYSSDDSEGYHDYMHFSYMGE